MKEVRSSGTKELIEEVKGLTDAMKQVGSAMASIGNSEVEFKTKGANKVIKDSEKVAEAIGKVKETADSMPKDVLSDELLGQTNAVQQRITKVKAELNKLWESVTNEDGSWSGKMLNEDQVKRYIDLYKELQKYVDIGATKKDKRFYDMINHINHLTEKPQGLKQYYDAAEEGEALRYYEKAMKAGRTEVNKQSKEEYQGSISALTAALQAMREAHEQLNSTQSETAQGIQETGQAAESAADQFMKLSDAYQQLSEIEQRIRQFGKNIEELKNAGVTDPNFRFDDEIVNEDEYKNELQQITSMLEEINKLKAQLDGMAIDPNASQAVERKGIGHANLDDLQSQLEERKRIVEQYLESDAFAESKIIEKQEELRQKITSHKDWYDYGEGTWIDEYVTKIRDEGMEIEEAYNELVNKLQENKQRVQEEQQRERDYETFDDFLREKAFGDYDTYYEYAEKYQEIANEIRNGGTTLARAMIDVGSEIDEALRQSADSSGGQDFTKPLIEQLETLEELKERAARLGSKGRIIDEEDMHDRIHSNMPGNGWDPDIYDYDGLEQYKQLLERLIELRDRALTSAREQQRAYIDWGDQSDYDEMNQFLERYNEYIAAINYMQERIEEMQNEKIQGFESSGEWDADSINWLVETLKTLAEEIRNVSQAFGRIDDESGIPTLLSQLQSLTTAITTAFNTDNIELFKQALSDVNSTLSAISSSIGPIGGGRSKESQEDMLSMRDRLRNIQYKTGATELNIEVVEGASEAEQKVKETLEKQNAGSKRTLQDIIAEALGIKSEGEETVLTQYQQNVEQLMETLTQFQDILSKGFGIQEKDGAITSYLSELIAKMEEVSTAAQNMTEAIQKAFNPEKDTTGLQGQILQSDIEDRKILIKAPILLKQVQIRHLGKIQEEQKNAIDSANALAQAQQQADDAVEDSSGRWARRKYWLDANGKELSKAEVSKQKYANKHVTTTYRSSRAKDEEGNLTDEWELNGIEVENNYEAAAKAAEKAEADKQKAVEKTNTFIIEQSSALERLKEKYIENSKVTIDQKDLDELATLKQQIDNALTELNSDNFTQSNATQIKQWIKDYQQKAQLAIARQQVSQELQAYSPEAARQRQETRLNDLMRQMQTSGADTTDLERRLNELMTTFRNAPKLTREFFTDIRNQYNILKDEFKDTDSVFKFNQSNIDKASTALENYEKAVEAVVKAKADLDFAKNKDDPVLVQNLEKAIEKAEEAKSKFIELKQFVFDYSNAGLTTQDFKDNMVGRANDANALLSDPTQGVYYQSKNMAQQQAENTAQLERQLDIIKQLAAARSLYNKIIAEDIAGKPSATDAEREALNQLIDEVKGKAEEAAEAINKMIQSGAVKLDDTGLKQFQELLDAMRYGDKSSIKLIDDAVLQRDVQTINEAQKAIQDYAKSVEKVNELQAKLTMGEGGKGIVDQITKATKEMNDLKKSADDAMDTLDRMNKDGFSQILSSKGFEDTQKAFKEANEMRDNIVNQSGNFGLENANRAYTTLIANAERYAQIIEKRASGKALSYNEVSFLSRLEQYYQDAANSAGIFANATDEVSQKLREQFNQAMNSADVNVVSRSYEQIGETLAKIGEGSWTEEGIKKLDELRAKYDQLTQSIGQIGTATKEQREAIRQSLREMATQMQGFLGNEKSNYLMADSRDVAVVNRQMSEWMTKNTLAKQYFPQIQELQQRLNGISVGGLTDVKAEFENIKREAIEAGKVGQTFGDALKKSFGGLARYMMTYASFYRIISVIRKAVTEVKELDSALMEVRKVSSETLSTLKQWQKLSFKQADEVGGSAVQIEKSTAAWLRLGKSFEEAQEAAQASVKLLNVSEFTNIDDATTSLVSMRQAFQDLTYEDFIDKLNGVGDNFSSSTDQLAQGMKNVSSVLKVAGNDIDQSLALLTAAIQLAVSYGNIIQRTYLIALIA